MEYLLGTKFTLNWNRTRDFIMMTSANGNILRVTGPLCGEFTGHGEFPAQRAVARRFDVFFDLRLNKRLSKQWWGWWFETPSRPFWRHCNEIHILYPSATLRGWHTSSLTMWDNLVDGWHSLQRLKHEMPSIHGQQHAYGIKNVRIRMLELESEC